MTLVGGGGKTTLLYALARQAVDAGYTVAVTTTTHILPHPGLPRSERPTRALLEARRAATVGTVGEKGKLTLAPETRPIQGGFLLVDGSVEVNGTFETLVRFQKGTMASEVAKILFPEG